LVALSGRWLAVTRGKERQAGRQRAGRRHPDDTSEQGAGAAGSGHRTPSIELGQPTTVLNQEQIADHIIQDHTLYAVAAGPIPIPLVDLAWISAVQVDLVRALARVNEVEFDPAMAKGLVAALVGASAVRLGTSVLKGVSVVSADRVCDELPSSSSSSPQARRTGTGFAAQQGILNVWHQS
jgi:hypothetical protein